MILRDIILEFLERGGGLERSRPAEMIILSMKLSVGENSPPVFILDPSSSKYDLVVLSVLSWSMIVLE